IAQRAPLMAERNAAIHAPRALFLKGVRRPRQHDLPPVANPLGHGPVRLLVPFELDEAGDLTHDLFLAPLRGLHHALFLRVPTPPPMDRSTPSAGSARAPFRGEASEGAVEAPSECTTRVRSP